MLFEVLCEAAERDELVLVDGGMCRYHLRRDGQLTIHEILVLPARRGQGIGTGLLQRLKQVDGASSIYARCPADLLANRWYARQGFEYRGAERLPSGRVLNAWRLVL